MLVQSNLYQLQRGSLSRNPARPFDTVPLIKLGEHFKKVNNYLSRFKGIPNVLELDHLTVSGDVTIGKDVTLKVRDLFRRYTITEGDVGITAKQPRYGEHATVKVGRERECGYARH